MEKSGIIQIMEYSEPFRNSIPMLFRILSFMKTGKTYVTLEIQNPGVLTILE